MEIALFNRMSLKEQALFARRLSFLVKAGMPLLDCLRLIRAQTKAPARALWYEQLIADVESGQYLAASLERHGPFLGEVWVHLVRVGEYSGILSQNLSYLADELYKKQELRRKVLGAMVYPLFITVATLGLVGLLTAYIFPKLMPVFAGLHTTLPLSTRALIATSAYLRSWGLLTVVALLGLGALFIYLRSRHERTRAVSDQALLYTPFAGRLVRAYNLATLCRTLGLLLESGVLAPAAMETVARATPNRVYRAACTRAAEALPRGETLSRAWAQYPALFPDLLLHLCAIGETTGTLSSTLLYVSQMYEDEVDELTRGLSSAVEPTLMLTMGLLVGFVAVSVIEPIYGITQHLTPR